MEIKTLSGIDLLLFKSYKSTIILMMLWKTEVHLILPPSKLKYQLYYI